MKKKLEPIFGVVENRHAGGGNSYSIKIQFISQDNFNGGRRINVYLIGGANIKEKLFDFDSSKPWMELRKEFKSKTIQFMEDEYK